MFLTGLALVGCGDLVPSALPLSALLSHSSFAVTAAVLFFLPRDSDKYNGNQPFPTEYILYGGAGRSLLGYRASSRVLSKRCLLPEDCADALLVV